MLWAALSPSSGTAYSEACANAGQMPSLLPVGCVALGSGNRGPRAQTFAQLGPGSHSDSASESARKPGVPSSQDLLGPRRQAGRPEAGHNVTPPPRAGRLLPFQFCDERPSP
ncbi:unnamed protein product [Rangifer tarandus platyrhynchus]|uniref:Uncharacterized protein n=2 Tax=Rangifer tarandus platyrhynchus TaxID=3082113 RepID=A0ABN8YEB7_RANTA|nr:unnamed protein product [Rangifer tarandus platyrhynchus]CAI9700237.1 unnamed protein product [Rangifer tarandus platyrhynchus]